MMSCTIPGEFCSLSNLKFAMSESWFWNAQCLSVTLYGFVQYLECRVDDAVDGDVAQFFGDAMGFIEQALSANGRVLIHCKMGMRWDWPLLINIKIYAFSFQMFPKYNRNMKTLLTFLFNYRLVHWNSFLDVTGCKFICSEQGDVRKPIPLHQAVYIQLPWPKKLTIKLRYS